MFHIAFIDDLNAAIFSDNIQNYTREDISVFSLRISQNEAELATAEVEIENPGLGYLLSLGKRKAVISESLGSGETVVRFRGSLVGIPTELAGEFCVLEFIAERETTSEEIKELAATLKTGDGYDPLFYDEDADDPKSALDARVADFYVDRRTLDVAISNALQGSKTIDVGSDIIDGSLQISVNEPPLSEITQTVEVEWEQVAVGAVNAAGKIRERFPFVDQGGNFSDMSTCTPDDFEQMFPGSGGNFDASTGWSFMRNNLQRVGYFDKTLRGWTYERDMNGYIVPEKYEVDIGVSTYKLDSFLCRYEYRQPRREKLTIKLNTSYQAVLGEVERKETLDPVLLNNVLEDRITPAWQQDTVYEVGQVVRYNGRNWKCVASHQSGQTFEVVRIVSISGPNLTTTLWQREARDASPLGDARRYSYFETDRGQQSVRHALERVRAYAMRRMRFLNVSVTIPWNDQTAEIDTDSSLRFTSRHVPGGAMIGKVTSYELRASDGVREIDVTLGVSVGTGVSVATLDDGTTLHTVEEWDSGDYQVEAGEQFITENGIVYDLTHDEIRVPVNPWLLPSPTYSIDRVEVVGSASEQTEIATFAAMESNDPEQVQGIIEEAIRSNPTRVSLRMRRIAPDDMIETKYEAITEPVHAPRGINLDGSISV